MPYTQNLENCFIDRVGNHGISKSVYLENLTKAKENFSKFCLDHRSHIDITRNETREIRELATQIRNNYKKVFIIGTGGSTNNAKALLPLSRDSNIEIELIENIDPESVNKSFAKIDLTNSCFLIISKSGGTLETVALTMALFEFFKSKNFSNAGKICYFITEPGNNILRNIAKDVDAIILDHDVAIGGRYAIFTNVGLLPAAISGLDIEKIREGASHIIVNPDKSLESAALLASFVLSKKPISVMMPYVDRLRGLVNWYRQLWCESTGKNGMGMTLLPAIGSVDQHSMLQLFLDGPKDKLFTIITLKQKDSGIRIFSKDERISYLNNKTIGDLMDAAAQSVIDSIIANDMPIRHISIEALDELTIGALLMHFTLETIIASMILNINPFDQPAVEQGKQRTIQNLLV